MKLITYNFATPIGQALTSVYFAFVLSIGIVATSCNSCVAQDNKSKTDVSKYHDIDVAQFDKMRENKQYIVLDIRTPEEIADGKVQGAEELDYYGDSFSEELAKLDKDKTYLVYCRSGGRSSNAAEEMTGMGFKSVYNLLGGYNDWSEAHPDDQ